MKEITVAFGEFGDREENITTYQYDKSGYRWPGSYALTYNKKGQVQEVLYQWEETSTVSGYENENGEWVDMEPETHTNKYSETAFLFEYDKDGRLSKEIVPDKVEYVFEYEVLQ